MVILSFIWNLVIVTTPPPSRPLTGISGVGIDLQLLGKQVALRFTMWRCVFHTHLKVLGATPLADLSHKIFGCWTLQKSKRSKQLTSRKFRCYAASIRLVSTLKNPPSVAWQSVEKTPYLASQVSRWNDGSCPNVFCGTSEGWCKILVC